MRPSSPVDAEYSYQYTSAAKGTRSTSPLHFLYPIMPSSSSPTRSSPLHTPSSPSSSHHQHHHHHHAHSLSSSHHHPGGKRHARRKEREQQEIARLLDPSYQGSSSSPSGEGRRSLEAYVDMDGDLHDPDFRYFPSAEAFVSRTKNGAGEGKRGSRARATSPRRPYWEQDNEHAMSDEEEEEELLAQELGSNDFLASAGHGNGTSESTPRTRTSRARRDGSFSSYGFGYSPAYNSGYSPSAYTHTHTPSYYSPTMTSSTLPTSYESENTVLSTSGDLDGEKEKDCSPAGVKGLLAAAKRRRRLSKGEKDEAREMRRSIEATRTSVLETTREEEHHQQQQQQQHSAEDAEQDRERAADDDEEDREFILSAGNNGDYVPTCTEVLQRHWLSVSLRFRFGVYRTQRRFMRRVHSFF